MALSSARLTPSRQRTKLNIPMAAAVLGYSGALAVLDANGNVKPGVTGIGLSGLGKFSDTFDNSAGIAGAKNADVDVGVFQFANSANADAITQADIDRYCYVVDDQTVAKTDGGSTRSVAGIVADVDAQGVWVDFTAGSRGGKIWLPLRIDDLVAADAKVYGIAAPVAGTITKLFWDLEGHAIAGADATLTGKIGANAITAGVITIPLAGSAIGNTGTQQPTAANVVAAGDRINFTGGGGNTNAAAFASLLVEITV